MQRSDQSVAKWIAVGAVALLLGACFFLFSSASNDGTSEDAFSQKLGNIIQAKGEVLRQHKAEDNWTVSRPGDSLFHDEQIFVGERSSATLRYLNRKIELVSTGYYSFGQSQDRPSIQITHGLLKTSLAPRDDLRLGERGKDILIRPQVDSKLVVGSVREGLRIRLEEGQMFAEALAYRSTLTAPMVITLHKDGRVTEERQETIFLSRPSRGQKLYLQGSATTLEFEWNEKKPAQEYRLALSSRPDFSDVRYFSTRDRQLLVRSPFPSGPLYWRVMNSAGDQSQVSHFTTQILYDPIPLYPPDSTLYELSANVLSEEVQFRYKIHGAPLAELVIAKDPGFFEPILNLTVDQESKTLALEPGNYYWKIRSHYHRDLTSRWSPVQFFTIAPVTTEPLQPLLPHLKLAYIPNLNYPESLYGAPRDQVKSHLAQSTLLKDFFKPIRKVSRAQLEILVSDQMDTIAVKNNAWPEVLLEPGSYPYRYRMRNSGVLATAWSAEHRLEIQMQAPAATVPERVKGRNINSQGHAIARLEWTPLLYAKSYELVVTDLSRPDRSNQLIASSANFDYPAEPSQTYQWKVRALDENSIPISPFSQAQRLVVDLPPALRRLASDPIPEDEIAPKIQTRVADSFLFDKAFYEREDNSYFWGWLGSGFAFMNYGQSQTDSTELSFSQMAAGTVSVEGGFIHPVGIGARVSYHRYPGQVDGQVLGASEYAGSTVSGEGLFRIGLKKTGPGRFISYGLNAGIINHTRPNLYIDSQDQVRLSETTLVMAGLGGDISQHMGQWVYEALFRYEHPISISTSAGGQVVAPTLAMSGSLGMSYKLSDSVKAGFFWYGQWLSSNLSREATGFTENGTESQFFSNMDFRLGFDF